MEKKQLPKLVELHATPEVAFKNDQLKLLLNQPVHAKWIRKHPLATTKDEMGKTVPAKYIPIDKIEFLLDRIFQEWRIEVLREGVMFNSVYVTIRLHYKNPINNEWSYHDGVGAKDMQKDSGTDLSMSTIKASAVMMALPSAKSFAIKDAAEHLGELFGRNLNRNHTLAFAGAYTPSEEQKESQETIKEDKYQDIKEL